MAERLKLIPFCMILLYLSFMAMSANAWHNDVGNDSCLVLYSDNEIYYTDPADQLLEVVVKANNNCGDQLSGNLAFYMQDKDLVGSEIVSIERAEPKYKLVDKSYACNNSIETEGIIVSCVVNDINGTDVQFSKAGAHVSGTEIQWTESELVLEYEELAELTLIDTPETGRNEFKKKDGWKDVKLKKGETYLRLLIQLPYGLIHKHGYFIVAFEDELDATKRSVLDPEWWETGEYTVDGDTVALYHFNQSAGTTIDDNVGTYDATASNALIWDAADKKWGSASAGFDGSYYFTQGTLMDVVPAAWTIEWWWMPNVNYNPGTPAVAWNFWHKQQDATNWVQNYLRNGNGDMYFAFKSSGTTYSLYTTRTAWTMSTWYHIAYVYDDGFISVYVNGVGEDTIAAPAWANGTGTDFVWNTNWTAIGTELDGDYEMDELAISDVNRFATPWTFPAAPSAPDVNVVSVDVYPDGTVLKMFSYFRDNNVTIDFNVFDAGHGALTLDLNYSVNNTQGTGSPIFDDLNLTTPECDSINWTTENVECHLDMNLMGITDHNYYIIGTIHDGTLETFFTSALAFGVDNTAPAVCAPIGLTGFLINDTEIDGAGTITACASDANVLVSCEYTTDTVWSTAELVGIYCTSDSITIEDNELYNFNIRAYDVAGNIGSGTVVSYIGKAYLVNPEAVEDSELIGAAYMLGYKFFSSIGVIIGTLLLIVIAAIVFIKVVPGRS